MSTYKFYIRVCMFIWMRNPHCIHIMLVSCITHNTRCPQCNDVCNVVHIYSLNISPCDIIIWMFMWAPEYYVEYLLEHAATAAAAFVNIFIKNHKINTRQCLDPLFVFPATFFRRFYLYLFTFDIDRFRYSLFTWMWKVIERRWLKNWWDVFSAAIFNSVRLNIFFIFRETIQI